jgi:hypothetical protein
LSLAKLTLTIILKLQLLENLYQQKLKSKNKKSFTFIYIFFFAKSTVAEERNLKFAKAANVVYALAAGKAATAARCADIIKNTAYII